MTETISQRTAAGRYLTFGVADEVYGIDILRVQEIVGMLPLTRVPRLSATVAGVVNLRGRVIPVLELRRSLGLPPVIHSDRTCVIIVRTEAGGTTRTTGLIVDAVSDVVDLSEDLIEGAPEFGRGVENSLLTGVARHDERLLLLLDIDTVLNECGVDEMDVDVSVALEA